MTQDREATPFEIVSSVLTESSKGKISDNTREQLARRIIEKLEETHKFVKKSTQNLILFMDPDTGEVHYAGEPELLTKVITQLVDLKIHEIGSRE